MEFWFIPHQTKEFYQLQAVDEQNHFASTVQVTFVFSTCPSSAFGDAHVPLLPSCCGFLYGLQVREMEEEERVIWHVSLKIGSNLI